MSLDPRLAKLLRYGLIGCGAMSVVSSITGIVGAFVLVEPSDEQNVGLSPFDFVGFYVLMLLIGAAMIGFGLRRWKK